MARARTRSRRSPWPDPLLPGVYFGLPAELHHNDPGLGSGDVRRLLIGAPEYWHESNLNPDRPPYEPTRPLEFGTAMHKLVLEGPREFRKHYGEVPDPLGLIVTDEDAAIRLGQMGVNKPPRLKADKIAEILRRDPKARIKDAIYAEAEREGRTLLPRADYHRIVNGALLLSQDPEYREAFTGGEPEVTVIYIRPDGVRCKSRFDYLKPRAIVDLKTVGNIRGIEFKRAVLNSFWNYRRDLQAEHYGEARRQLPELVRQGRVFGKKVDAAWLREVATPRPFAFVYIWFASIGAPVHWGFKLSPGNTLLQIARDHIEAAIERYKMAMTEFGPNKTWLMREPLAELDISDFPNFAYR